MCMFRFLHGSLSWVRFAGFVGASLIAINVVQADTIPLDVPNFSFESPTVPSAGYTLGGITSWTVNNSNRAGLENAAASHSTPQQGSQLAWFSTSTSGGGALWQTLSKACTVGETYQLTVGATIDPSYTGSVDNKMAIRLYYLDTSDVRQVLVSKDILRTDLYPTRGTMSDFTTATTMIAAADPCVGRPLGVWIGDAYSINTNINFLVDNVRVSATIPEPSVLSILTTGILGLLAYAWRKRK